jgi:hypothetical protein
MAGPICEVLLEADDGVALDTIDAILTAAGEHIGRTRKGRVWDAWVAGRPVHVSVGGSPPAVTLAAGCNCPEDYDMLRRLAGEMAAALGGVASEPEK